MDIRRLSIPEINYEKKFETIASRSCGEQNNTVSICTPEYDSVWYNDTDQRITWKYNNPKFVQYTLLDLHLLYKNSSDEEYKSIKNWTDLSKDKGILVTHIDDSWYPTIPSDNSPSVSFTMYMYIVGAGYDIYTDLNLIPTEHNFFPAPQSFTLIQNARNTTTVTSTTSPLPTETAPVRDDKGLENKDNQSKKLPDWAIAVIVIAVILFLLAVFALVWMYKRYKNKKQLNHGGSNKMALHGDDEKIPVLTPNKNESNIHVPVVGGAAVTPRDNNRGDIASINSSTQQLWSPRSLSPRHDEISFITTSEKPITTAQPHQPLGLHSEANQSSSILSSTDALMIADTFRQFMRKPDWNEELELNEQNKKSLKKEDL
ncbi:hypothetical protein BD770DRAFT_442690 [Pilaira anomala]|nr:hypothetical protein BD770DRAFT_442690 [Pilaira anomala]